MENNKPWQIKLETREQPIKFKIDTGADETILSYKIYKKMFENVYKLRQTRATLLGPGTSTDDRQLKVYGKIKLPVKWRGNDEEIKCYVAETSENLLGRPALMQLNIVKWKKNTLIINNIKNSQKDIDKKTVETRYPEIFKGIGKLKNFEYKIRLRNEAKPYAVTVPRRVPIPLQKEVEMQLNKMVADDIIERVEEPTEWCAPMVVAQNKKGKK